MSGSETQGSEPVWYDLVDPATERAAGQVTHGGEIRGADPEVEARVRAAFRREMLAENGELAEELGVCFAGIETVTPDGAGHHDLVFRNLSGPPGRCPSAASRTTGHDRAILPGAIRGGGVQWDQPLTQGPMFRIMPVPRSAGGHDAVHRADGHSQIDDLGGGSVTYGLDFE